MATMQERPIDTPGQSSAHGLAYELASIVSGLVAGFVLPIILFFVLVGIPFVMFPIAGLVKILDLPDPIGLITWYVALGSIGGILSGFAKWAYATGPFVFFAAYGPVLSVWLWVGCGLIAWVSLGVIAVWTDERPTAD
jgi:hypothetical protein